MSKRIQQRATINGKTKWLSGSTQQEIFDAYLCFAIDEGIVLPAGGATQKRESPVIFENRAWKWFQLYKVGKVRLTTLANYETYLKNIFCRTSENGISARLPSTMCRSFSI